MAGVVWVVVWLFFFTYCCLWLVVAVASDPTWWWFVPIFGTIKIFEESVWWGLFCVGILPAGWIAGLFADRY
jgi:hypothetical protein